MKLTKDKYVISRKLMERVLDVLQDNWFCDDGEGDEFNNDDVISCSHALEHEIYFQENALTGDDL
jgi:hypothetical protein